MTQPSLDRFLTDLERYPLLAEQQWQTLRDWLAQNARTAEQVGAELVRRGWLSEFQVERILQGKVDSLKLGNYLLLDRLGSGGMGEVFRARHLVMQRLVALKIIHPSLLNEPGVVERFSREIQVLSQLRHPNVVLAHDATRTGATFFYVMECLQGTDLATLAERQPLSVAQTCEYIRQAALGLQYLHERGLTHRDIKPHNLFREASTGLVKLLDLGLIRVLPTSQEEPDALTQEGRLMGTVDYLAPEQAQDPRQADIRADIYGLGCTLYFLLSRRAPFPGGSITQKLLKHQREIPTPIEQIRPDVPPELAQILRRMMAKRPEQRFQTPGELALAIAPFTDATHEESDAVAMPVTLPGTADTSATTLAGPSTVGVDTPSSKVRWGIVAGLVVCGILGLSLLMPTFGSRDTPDSPTDDPPSGSSGSDVEVVLANLPSNLDVGTKVFLDGNAVALTRLQAAIELAPGPHRLEVKHREELLETRTFDVFPSDAGHTVALRRVPLTEPTGKPGEIKVYASSYSRGQRGVAFGPLGKHFVCCSSSLGWSGGVDYWHIEGSSPLQPRFRDKYGWKTYDNTHAIAYSPSGQHIALALNEGGIGDTHKDGKVCLWDISRKVLASWTRKDQNVTTLAFTPDARHLLVSYQNPATTEMWSIDEERIVQEFEGSHSAISADGRWLLTGLERELLLHHLVDKSFLRRYGPLPDKILDLTISADGSTFACVTVNDAKPTIHLWDRQQGQKQSLTGGHERQILCIALSPTGRWLASGGWDSTLALWDVRTGKVVHPFTDHEGRITDVEFSPTGRRLLSASDDKTVRLWQLPD